MIEQYIAIVKRELNKGFLHLKKNEEVTLTCNDVKSWKQHGYLIWMSKLDECEIIDNTYIDVYKVTKTITYEKID